VNLTHQSLVKHYQRKPNQKEAEDEYFLLLEHSYEVGDTTANLGSPDRKK